MHTEYYIFNTHLVSVHTPSTLGHKITFHSCLYNAKMESRCLLEAVNWDPLETHKEIPSLVPTFSSGFWHPEPPFCLPLSVTTITSLSLPSCLYTILLLPPPPCPNTGPHLPLSSLILHSFHHLASRLIPLLTALPALPSPHNSTHFLAVLSAHLPLCCCLSHLPTHIPLPHSWSDNHSHHKPTQAGMSSCPLNIISSFAPFQAL